MSRDHLIIKYRSFTVGLERKEYSVSENSSQGVEVCIIFTGIETVTVNISTEDITAIGMILVYNSYT